MSMIEEDNKCCGTCFFHKLENAKLDEWSCDNHDGEYFGDYTEYNDKCPDWRDKGDD